MIVSSVRVIRVASAVFEPLEPFQLKGAHGPFSGRIVPIGGMTGLKVTSNERDVARLLHDPTCRGFGPFREFFGRIPFKVVD